MRFTYHFAINRKQPFDDSRVKLDGICDVSHDLLKGVCSLLVEQDPYSLARLYSTADNGYQFGPNEVLALFSFWASRLGTTKGRRVTDGDSSPSTN